jgi:hypothetical protein
MKRSFSKIILAALLPGVFVSCGLDNYEPPKSMLTGRVVCKGTDEAVPVRGTGEAVWLQLYQSGYHNYTPINVRVTQDGSFSALLFDGDYRMVTRDNNGPWNNTRDTTYFSVRGATVQDKEVIPYYMIRDASMSLVDGTLTANFTVVNTGSVKTIDRIMLMVNKTTFVADVRQIQTERWTGTDADTGNHTLSMELSEGAKQSQFLFGRICVWTTGADQGVYSQVFKLK